MSTLSSPTPVLVGALLLTVATLGACTHQVRTESPQLSTRWLAERLEVPPEEVRLVLAEEREWSDSCLGLGGPAESCLAVVTPGWQFFLEAEGQLFEVRTDKTGGAVRSPQLASHSPGPPGGGGEPLSR